MFCRYLLTLLFCITVVCPLTAADKVDIQLTYPNGKSPKVFTTGWKFGAKAILNPGSKDAKDLSKQVQWSGSGIFSPKVGAVSHPAFAQAGPNTIELSVKLGNETFTERYTIQTVSSERYATVGDKALCSADSHGCPACPHTVIGPIKTGSSTVKINGKPAARVGDTGTHEACCGSNTFKIVSGDPDVLIDGRPAARLGDKTAHCGGIGKIVDASITISNKYNGTFSGSASGKSQFTIASGSVSGTFIGSHGSEGGGSANVTLKGAYNPRSGVAEGTISGTAGYLGLDNKPATARVSGTFTGRTKGKVFKGTWKGSAKGISTMAVKGSFSATNGK